MALIKYKLGELIQLCEARNEDLQYNIDDVKGISIQKIFIETKADMSGVSLKPYYLVNPDDFAYVTVTSRNGEKITIAHNTTEKTYIVSSSYVVFRIKEKNLLLSDYLFIYFNRPEFDRYARFNSWGSARETFSWEDMCDIEIELPPIFVQQKYVDIYNAMLTNQKGYEQGLEDLKLVCDAYIEDLRRKMPCNPIGKYISEYNVRNEIGLPLDSVRGIATSKEFINTKADMNGVSLNNYKIVEPGMIAFISDTSRRADKMSLALNQSNEPFLVSSISTVVKTNESELASRYLYLFLSRTEFDRYARFHSWGSARETFSLDDMNDVAIPIPGLEIQKAILEIHEVYAARKNINEKLKAQIKNICPILIKGSIEEGRRTEEA
ncbi:restriction endonuclease subunit S [Anaerotignum sp.]|uniref:restriction endonuclease subunit S n=1 Tax=Anaerotignum sp. TaxID=2039241 RepID=UPI002A818AB2|nr:restriction endonuclease subunit S [Anaerotignum sp.]MDY3596972.1 restriction endonuclease subunit S [Anaerotignum sp.]